ncbi:LysR family transcriptional regulator [Photobacterium rosenbergii]|uniref:LysR family transcriptional regulator n=1 Tax=Photobacterium rosenbergii TaxID=294936 RepID=UPI001C99C658|nr:LysR family transcriptional regulator [Photobacterium rosenbergii]MBY5944431.1 LysR family transcriptional regulator [Photobacterium rosenbergii]
METNRKENMIDLNVLRIFQVVYITKNTSLAAKKLDISQPQVSRSLQKLRNYYNDAIFIRSKNGLSPTPLADKLSEVIPSILDSIYSVEKNNSTFEPSSYNREITIALSTVFQNDFAYEIAEEISKKAPNAKLNIITWDDKTLSAISSNFIDIGVNYSYVTTPKDIYLERIQKDRFYLFARNGHPIFNKPQYTLKDIFENDFCVSILKGFNDSKPIAIDIVKTLGYELKVRQRSDNIALLKKIVLNTNSILIGTSRFIEQDCKEIREIDIDVEEYSKYFEGDRVYTSVFFQQSNRKSEKIIWLKKIINEIINKG